MFIFTSLGLSLATLDGKAETPAQRALSLLSAAGLTQE
jgi:hypothetical protein